MKTTNWILFQKLRQPNKLPSPGESPLFHRSKLAVNPRGKQKQTIPREDPVGSWQWRRWCALKLDRPSERERERERKKKRHSADGTGKKRIAGAKSRRYRGYGGGVSGTRNGRAAQLCWAGFLADIVPPAAPLYLITGHSYTRGWMRRARSRAIRPDRATFLPRAHAKCGFAESPLLEWKLPRAGEAFILLPVSFCLGDSWFWS